MHNEDPEALLRSRVRDTRPEFEQRWIALKRSLRTEPRKRRSLWLWWLAPAAAATLLLAFSLSIRPSRERTSVPVHFSQLLDFDADLSEALPLDDSDLTQALLEMPLQPLNPS